MSNQREIEIPTIRLDRSQMRKPRLLDDGTKVYEARLAVADQPLEYPWGTEVPTKECLSDPEYLEALRGLSLIAQHPPDREIKNGIAPPSGDGRRAGTVISSRFDDTDSTVYIEMAVPLPADQRLIEQSLGQVSEGYTPIVEARNDGLFSQIKRKPNHVALTDLGRADRPYIRIDSKGRVQVNVEEFMQKLEAMTAQIAEMKSQMDSLMSEKDAAVSDAAMARTDSAAMKKVMDEVVKVLGEDVRNDAAKVQPAVKALCEREGGQIADLRGKASLLNISIPEAAKDSQTIRKSIALALGADQARCDSAEFCDGLIYSAAKQASQETNSVRNDSKKETYPI